MPSAGLMTFVDIRLSAFRKPRGSTFSVGLPKILEHQLQ